MADPRHVRRADLPVVDWTDHDQDGLSAAFEERLGTNPRQADTDHDGLDDAAELHYGTDPRDLDSDGDLLSDGREVEAGTNPHRVDTDGDGLSDLEEVLSDGHLDPTEADTDGDGRYDGGRGHGTDDQDRDGLPDGLESSVGTDPNFRDDDRDGLSDGYEVLLGTDPRKYDTDGDRLGDFEELNLGTDPTRVDTDGDGLSDLEETGPSSTTDPLDRDSDDDGFRDGHDVTPRLEVQADPGFGDGDRPPDLHVVASGTFGIEAGTGAAHDPHVGIDPQPRDQAAAPDDTLASVDLAAQDDFGVGARQAEVERLEEEMAEVDDAAAMGWLTGEDPGAEVLPADAALSSPAQFAATLIEPTPDGMAVAGAPSFQDDAVEPSFGEIDAADAADAAGAGPGWADGDHGVG